MAPGAARTGVVGRHFCYVFAPNQCGKDGNGIKSYGHSIAIDPAGKILGILENSEEGILYVNADKKHLPKNQKLVA